MSAADSNTSLPEKKTDYTFGHNETLLLISLYQKYEVFFSDVSYKKRAIWQMIADDMKKNGFSPSAITARTGGNALHLHSGRFFMQTIRIIPSIPVPTILIPELWIKKRALS